MHANLSKNQKIVFSFVSKNDIMYLYFEYYELYKIKNNSILYYHLVFSIIHLFFSKAQTEVHKMKKLNIALLGLGTVGSGVVKIIEENRQQIQDTLNKDIVKSIFLFEINLKETLNISQYHLTEDVNEILNDDSLDIIVEVMGGIEPTVDWLRTALKIKHVITANKDLLAVHLKLLEDLAEENGVALKFEASVAGGIPIVNAINNGLNANNISKFMGILNGTSNFILSKMTKEQTTFEEALDEAKRLGFAEADQLMM